MFNIKNLILLLTLLLTFTLAYADDDDDDTKTKNRIKVYPVAEGVTLTSAIKFQYGKPRIIIKSVTPLLNADNEDDEGIKQFNDQVADMVKQESGTFTDQVAKINLLQKKLPRSNVKNNLYIDYDTSIVKAEDHLISVRFTIQGMISGMAHPYHYHRVYNYDLENNQKIELSELFKPDTDYLSFLSNYSREALARHLTNQEMIQKGTAPTAENFSNWNIKPRGILITFEEYQVAPYVQGAQTVLIPYSALKEIISPLSPIADCVKSKRKCLRNNVLTGGFIDEAINSTHRRLNPILSKL